MADDMSNTYEDMNNVYITSIAYEPGSLGLSIRTVTGANGAMCCWVGGAAYTVRSNSYKIGLGLTLTPDASLSCQIAWGGYGYCSGAIGPRSPAVPILTYVVELQYVQYDAIPDAPSVEVGWLPATNYSGGYLATLTVPGQAPMTATADGTSCVFTLDAPLTGDGNTVSVQAFETVNNAASYGPAATSPVPTV